ncbi:TniQ family protein [Pseudomonas sp. MIL19]|uniref:TniQ family protein n=1 Tax=Pseudomonas sp. MIL19 TaxID=2976979 RepID=UPI0023645B56|nr:TniQ family protein [Pseudomonas sp. MIL19]MDD2162611.1 TniQ family protein [Pseudomonas sp. MIL19]
MSFFQTVPLTPGASLNSLLMRKAEQNGYGTAHVLLRDAGLTMKVSYSLDELEQLKACFELASDELALWRNAEGRYLAQKSFLRRRHSPVCPACLIADKVAQGAWSHVLVTACHTHQTGLISQCPQCMRQIFQSRRELMRCDCGYDLRCAPVAPASLFATELSALMAGASSSACRALPDAFNQLGYEPLLPELLVLLAKAQGRLSEGLPAKFRFGSSSSVEDSVAMVSFLESLLGEWPQRFDATLQNQLSNGTGVGLAQRIGSWYRELFSTYSVPSFDFLRDRFKALIAEHFDGRLGLSTRAMMFGANSEDALQWFSAAEAARLLGVAPDILANLVINKVVAGKVHQEGKSRFVAIHRTTLDQIASQRASYLSATEARERLNVSKNFFERFIQAGGLRRYKRDERPVLVAGEFRLEDVERVIKLLVGSVRKNSRASQLIGLQDISEKHGVSNSKIVGVLQGVLQGTLRPVAHVGSLAGLAGLQFDKADIDQRVRDNNPDVALSVDDLARVSGWKAGVIKKWIQGRYLGAVEETHGKAKRDVVPVSALIEFLLTYMPTSELSKQLDTKTQYLIQSWRPAKIEILVPPQEAGGGQRGLLVRNADLARAARLRKPTIRELAEQLEEAPC